jgi:predicted nuclease of predicted toxin-antitoxin system
MKLLFDHNLSPQLVKRLSELYPESQHVFLVNMDQADDRQIWEYAAKNSFTVVTRDSDYNDLSLIRGFPPKIIWIRRGNCSTQEIEQILRRAVEAIKQFEQDPSNGVLTLT